MEQVEKCRLKGRKDDIPKRSREKSWACDTCGALMFSPKKPFCVRVIFNFARDQATAEADRLHIED